MMQASRCRKKDFEEFGSVVAPANRGDGSVAAGRPAKGGHGTDGLGFDGPVQLFSDVASPGGGFGTPGSTWMHTAAS